MWRGLLSLVSPWSMRPTLPAEPRQDFLRLAVRGVVTSSDWRCSLCSEQRAALFCYCDKVETLLCEACLPAHHSTGRLHLCLPISAYGQHTRPGYFDRLAARSEHFARRRTEMMRNLDTIDQCITDFAEKVDDVIGNLCEYRESTIGKLRDMRKTLERDIVAAVQKAEDAMFVDSLETDDRILAVLRSSEVSPDEAKLFSYKITEKSFPSSLSDIVSFGRNTTELRFVPSLVGNELKLYSLSGKVQRSVPLAASFDHSSMMAFDNSVIFLVSGDSREAISISTSAFELTVLPPRNYRYSYSGVYLDTKGLFLFGGYLLHSESQLSFPYKSTEMFSASPAAWSRLPDMNFPRSCFTPCRHSDDLYLATADCVRVERFSLARNEFKVIPASTMEGDLFSVSCVFAGELILLGLESRRVYRLSLEATEPAFRVTRVEGSEKELRPACVAPALVGREIVWAQAGLGTLCRLNLATNTLY